MRSCERPGYYDVPFEERRKAAAHLWENEETLRKYLDKLRDLSAARIRAELYNHGLRGKELIAALRERLMSEHGFKRN